MWLSCVNDVHQTFTLQIGPAEDACRGGDSDVLINAQMLRTESSTESTHARTGTTSIVLQSANSEARSKVEVWWRRSCVCLKPGTFGACEPEDMAKVLMFVLHGKGNWEENYWLGFTATYKQFGKPEVIRISPFVDELADTNLDSKHWRTPSVWRASSMPESETRLMKDCSASLSPSKTSTPDVDSSPTSSAIPVRSTVFNPTFSSSGMKNSPTGPTEDLPSLALATNAPEKEVSQENNLKEVASTTSSPEIVQPQVRHGTVKSLEHEFTVLEAKFKGLGNAFMNKVNGLSSCIKHKQSSHSQTKSGVKQEDITVFFPQLDALLTSHPLNKPLTAAPTPYEGLSVMPPPSSTDVVTLPSSSSRPSYHRPGNDQDHRACAITFAILAIITLVASLLTHLSNDPRRRADWAARREECRNRRLYRRAARHERWRKWLCGLLHNHCPTRASVPPETWDEKRVLTIERDGLSQLRLREEIYALRNACSIVDGVVRAEEGRNIEAFEIHSGDWRRETPYCESGSEASGPPPYDESGVVVDGFHYTPPGSPDTPDSSVIETSPRTSLYIRDGDYEKD